MVGTQRWNGPRSEFPWEEEALKFIRDRLSEVDLYCAWQTFSFTAKSGHIREVDLFVATPGGLYLVEIKSHPGELSNRGSSWQFRHERVRTIENPLSLTNIKSKEIKGQLTWAARKLGLHSLRIPFIAPAIFLSDPGLASRLDEVQRQHVYGRDGLNTGLPGVVGDLLTRPPRSERDRVDPAFIKRLPDLMRTIGVMPLRKHRKVGQWELAPKALDAGPTWEDYLATNTALEGQHRRVRLYLSELKATTEERQATRRVARREYLVLQGIQHTGILAALDFSEEHEAGPAVLFPHRPSWLRLDHYLSEYGDKLDIDTRVDMIRQLAEALDHAHRRHLYHRALAARSVWVEFHSNGRYPKLRIADWQAAQIEPTGSLTTGRVAVSEHAAPSLIKHIEKSAEVYLAPELGRPGAESVPLDVFGLGTLAYLILTRQPPATGRGDLIKALETQDGLMPSAVEDSVGPLVDDLVRSATKPEVCDRIESMRNVLERLDAIEDRLRAADEEDPLQAKAGSVVAGWKILNKLGTGSTARALLVERGGQQAVLKVALNEQAVDRLVQEAAVLRRLRDSHIVRLAEGPVEIGERTLIVLDRAGDRSLAEHIRSNGRLSIEELEKYGEDLFSAVEYLEGEGVLHRDIKPDNIAIRTLTNRQTRLVLFDFSLANTDVKHVTAGTPTYLDPFLGTSRRPIYDAAAELYAVSVTLHEMASAEHPSWGDGATEPRLLDASETVPQLAEDRFDLQLREGLAAFFRRALHRDARERFADLKELRESWRSVFRTLNDTRPLTTPSTANDKLTDPEEARDKAAEAANEQTPLAAAGLTPKALSVARDDLGVDSVGELIKIPGARIQRLRGVGVSPRNELLRRAREWRRRFKQTESARAAAETERQARGEPIASTADDYSVYSLDEIVGRLMPRGDGTDVRAVAATLALPSADGRATTVPPWPSQRFVAEHLGVSQGYVGVLLGKARSKWIKDPAVTNVRHQLLDILGEAGRVMEVSELAVELLALRGSTLSGSSERLLLASAVVRAAIETEERLDNPRLFRRRSGDKILVALVAENDPTLPSDAQLLDYAQRLGARADDLVRRDPLPVTATVVEELHAVARPEGMVPLADTRLVSLSAAASARAAVTSRFELYPVDLDPVKAVRLAQVGSLLTTPITPEDLRQRLLARLPALRALPQHPELRKVLRDAEYPIEIDNGRYCLPSTIRVTGSTTGSAVSRGSTGVVGVPTASEAVVRLHAAARRGGFLVLKVRIRRAAELHAALCGRTDLPVSCVDVSTQFVTALREIRNSWKSPDWPTVLAADSAEAPPDARLGFGEMVAEAFGVLEREVRSQDGIVLLHDAAPLAHYAGGMELLARLAEAGRSAHDRPRGLWLLAPMDDPSEAARLDRRIVEVTPGGNEELALSQSALEALTANLNAEGKAS